MSRNSTPSPTPCSRKTGPRTCAALALALVVAPLPAQAETVAVPWVMIGDVSIKEGDDGKKAFTTTVQLLNWHAPVTIDLTAMSDTATASDFDFPTTRLQLTPGAAAQTVHGTISGDLDPESDEVFHLRATVAMGPGYPYFAASQGGRITIIDDDSSRAPRLSVQGARLPEGDDGETELAIPVRLDPPSNAQVTVDWVVQPMTATAPTDVVFDKGTLTFAPGETIQNLIVRVRGDRDWEIDETFSVVLQNPHRATLENARAEIVIVNDDPATVLRIDDVHVREGTGGINSVQLTIRWSGAPPDKIHVSPLGGTATKGSDYRAEFEVLYPRPPQTSVTYEVVVVGDAVPECTEEILIEYVAIGSGDPTRRSARITITDDDGAPASACPAPGGMSPAPPAGPVVARDGGTAPPPGRPGADGGPPVPPGQNPDGGAGAAPSPPPSSLASRDDGMGCSVSTSARPGLCTLLFGLALVGRGLRRRRR